MTRMVQGSSGSAVQGSVRRVAIAAALCLTVQAAAQQASTDALWLDGPNGRLAATIQYPAQPARPPVVLLASTSDMTELSNALAAEGIATLRLADGAGDADVAPEILAQWVTKLRNNERFPTVTVLADGVGLAPGVVAARAARADGVVTLGPPGTTALAEIGRLIAAVSAAPVGSVADTAAHVARFAKTVPVLGRRASNGSSSARPATARRSPRHTIMAYVDGVRVSIEWGQPQKRGREIWGQLVKWNELWMPGADEATVITTNAPVTIGTITLPAGDHTLYTYPTEARVELIVSKDAGQFHTVHKPELDLGRVEMTQATRPEVVEGLTFAIEKLGEGSALKMMWDTREYSVAIRKSAKP
jgi:hypothetical protein